MKWLATFVVDIPGSKLERLTRDDLDCSVAHDVKCPMGYSEVRFISSVPYLPAPETETTIQP